MPTQMNFGPKSPYKTAKIGDFSEAKASKPQMNFDYGGNGGQGPKGGTNRSRTQEQTDKLGIGAKPPKSHFGEKSGTGSQGGY